MEAQDLLTANAALTHVLAGRYVVGVLFYAGYPRLVVDELHETAKPVRAGVGVYIASSWKMFKSHPGSEIGNEAGFPEQDILDLCRTAGDLMNVRITKASIASPAAHLLIEFEGGRTLALDGSRKTVEGWEVNSGDFGILANQGHGVAYWTPGHFTASVPHAS